MPDSRIDLKSENERLKDTLSYFIAAEIVAAIILIIVLIYLFRNRTLWKQKQELGAKLSAARQEVNTCGILPDGAMIPAKGCAKGTPYKCRGSPVRAFVQGSKYDIYRRSNPESSACNGTPSHSNEFRGGLGSVCKAEDKLYNMAHGSN